MTAKHKCLVELYRLLAQPRNVCLLVDDKLSLVNREICFIKGGLTKLGKGEAEHSPQQTFLQHTPRRRHRTLHRPPRRAIGARHRSPPPFPPMTCVQAIPKHPTFTTTPAVEGSVRREKKSTSEQPNDLSPYLNGEIQVFFFSGRSVVCVC
ncbi:hypothetical protein TNCT_614421 [Trichonephila clavata]|uniref:Uncharacterized protein n=1 Tax=Trichonephila clavata TaxID=2740835 RepID=A0A8X6FX55_TRICU|nr:hypothetical protein TNCT_674661 [Trichonephila clavata]GFQ90372.1 hypothetical protein TNCT_614421 [Trichonephila clavata]